MPFGGTLSQPEPSPQSYKEVKVREGRFPVCIASSEFQGRPSIISETETCLFDLFYVHGSPFQPPLHPEI